jgi:hypothetical protein
METIRVQLRDKTGAAVTIKDIAADTRRIEHEGRWYRRGGGGSAVQGDPVRLSFHEESDED